MCLILWHRASKQLYIILNLVLVLYTEFIVIYPLKSTKMAQWISLELLGKGAKSLRLADMSNKPVISRTFSRSSRKFNNVR